MNGRRAPAGRLAGTLLLLVLGGPSWLAAQEVIPGGHPMPVTTEVAPGHWVMDALRRAQALGLLERPLPFRGTIAVDEAADLLDGARKAAESQGVGVQRLAAGWYERLMREYGGLASRDPEGWRLLGLRAAVEAAVAEGEMAPGYGEVEPWRTGGLPLDDRAEVGASFEATLSLGERVGMMVEPEVGTEGVRLRRADITTRIDNVTLALGRHPLSYAGSAQTGLVLSGAAALDRFEVRSTRPFTLPGTLRRLGPLSADLFLSRLWNDDRHQREQFVWGGNLTLYPFPRFGVAVHRGVMFGGKGYDEPVTVKTFVDMLIGRVANLGFENQIVSVEGRLRLPTEAWAPLTAYLEWGAEDAAGGWWDVPARVIGLETPAVPGAEALSLGAAYTSITAHCCGNPPWYRHHAFYGNWVADERPLGHPLGGEGWEWAAYGAVDRPDAGLKVEARVHHRQRSGQNLYVPGRGRSDGLELRASWMERPGVEVRGEIKYESGRGWTERGLDLGAHLFF